LIADATALLKNAEKAPKANPQEIAAFKERAGTLSKFCDRTLALSRCGLAGGTTCQLNHSGNQLARAMADLQFARGDKRGAVSNLKRAVKFADDWVDAAQARFDEGGDVNQVDRSAREVPWLSTRGARPSWS